MKKIFTILLILISLNVLSQNNADDSNKNATESITLREFVEKIKSQTESIKNAESINVMVDDLLMEKLDEYMINPKNVLNVEILVLEPHDGNYQRSKPSIIIKTK